MKSSAKRGETDLAYLPRLHRGRFRRAAIFASSMLVVFLWVAAAFAEMPPQLSEKGKRAYSTIVLQRQFCSTAVGIGGDLPEVVKAFRILLADPNADQAFKALLVSAQTGGKLYALCGIYYTDPEHFEKYAAPFIFSRAQVETVMGCTVMSEPVSKIVKSTAPGTVRLKDRAATVKQWEEETKPKTMFYDIVGGGWPDSFKEEGGFRRRAG